MVEPGQNKHLAEIDCTQELGITSYIERLRLHIIVRSCGLVPERRDAKEAPRSSLGDQQEVADQYRIRLHFVTRFSILNKGARACRRTLMRRISFILLIVCVFAAFRTSAGVEPNQRVEGAKANETLRAFEPRDPDAVQNAVLGIYAVFAIALLGTVIFFVGWVRYYSPRYWQRNDPPPQLVESRVRSHEDVDTAAPLPEDRDRFDLEGDIVDFIDRVERSNE